MKYFVLASYLLASTMASAAVTSSAIFSAPQAQALVANVQDGGHQAHDGDHEHDGCAGIKDRLVQLQKKNNKLLNSLVSNVQETAGLYSSWYDTYRNDYGKTVYVPYDSYENIRVSAENEKSNYDLFNGRSMDLQSEMMSVIVDLASCKISD